MQIHMKTASFTRVHAPTSMAPKLSLLVLFFLLFPTAGTAAAARNNAFNITEILGRLPEFRLMNFLLTKTRVASEINSRKAVTVLVPDNDAVDDLLRHSSLLRRTALTELLAVHVVLDYLDAAKIAELPRGRPAVFTTLYQTTGVARGRAGFLNVTTMARGRAVFASAAPGGLATAKFKGVVAAQPYNKSVLQISNFVLPPGIITKRPAPPPLSVRHMSKPPSPAPAPLLMLPPRPAMVSPVANITVTPAPSPSSSHAGQAASWWAGVGVAMAVACMLG